MKVEPDGGMVLHGTVNSTSVKETLERDSIDFPEHDDPERRERKITNEPKVDTSIATQP